MVMVFFFFLVVFGEIEERVLKRSQGVESIELGENVLTLCPS